MKNKRKTIFYLGWILFLAFLLILHQAVFMYHDDYGYASLTYGYKGNAHGMNWNILDLFKFIKWHYLEWGGRVFYFFFFVVALKLGENFIQIFQAVVYFLINVAIYKSCKRQDYDYEAMIIVVLGWLSIGTRVLIDGMLWYTASAIYVWPFLAFFFAVFFSKSNDNKKKIASGILFFCAGFSQEQVAFFVIVYSLCKVVEAFIKDKKSIKIYLCGILGGIVLYAAPGNWIRVGDNSGFYDLSLIDKLVTNFPSIFMVNFDTWSVARVIMYVVLLCVLGKALLKKWMFVLLDGIIGALFVYGVIHDNLFFELIFAVCLIAEIIIYLVKAKKYDCIFIFIAALATQGMLVVSPVVAPRTCIPFAIPMGYVAAVILVDLLHDGLLAKAGICAFGLIAVINTYTLTKGYYSNYSENTYDRKVLKATSQAIKDGEDIKSVKLKKLENDFYSGGMPYNIEYIKYWMKDYYEIPQSVEFIWE